MVSHGVEIYSLLLEDSRDVSQGVGGSSYSSRARIGSHEHEVMSSGSGVPVSEPTLHALRDS